MDLFQFLRESLISFDDEAVAPSQAPSVNTVTSEMQALSKLLTLGAFPIITLGVFIKN